MGAWRLPCHASGKKKKLPRCVSLRRAYLSTLGRLLFGCARTVAGATGRFLGGEMDKRALFGSLGEAKVSTVQYLLYSGSALLEGFLRYQNYLSLILTSKFLSTPIMRKKNDSYYLQIGRANPKKTSIPTAVVEEPLFCFSLELRQYSKPRST